MRVQCAQVMLPGGCGTLLLGVAAGGLVTGWRVAGRVIPVLSRAVVVPPTSPAHREGEAGRGSQLPATPATGLHRPPPPPKKNQTSTFLPFFFFAPPPLFGVLSVEA